MNRFPAKEKFFLGYTMQLDRALILSAGMGTRMGEIGKQLPKVLWPIFSKKLIDLQIDYCIDLGIKNIYINVHYLAEEIKKHISTSNYENIKITILHEEPLLDSGGAIHNLARRNEVNYQGNVLLVNGDQFLFFGREAFDRALDRLKLPSTRASLFGISVGQNETYNETILENELLIDIQKSRSKGNYVTYSGLGIIRLEGLKPVEGISKFFQTVVNYKFEKTYMILPEKYEYWDFGTAELYCKNIFKIARNDGGQPLIKQFLSSHLVNYTNFSNFIDLKISSIDLDQNGNLIADKISSRNISQKI